MLKAKTWIYARRFQGVPKESDFRLQEEELPELRDGEILVEVEFMSVSIGYRVLSQDLREGQVFIGDSLGKVIESNSSKVAVGEYVTSDGGWRSHSIINTENPSADFQVLSDFENLPKSLALGALGIEGSVTAYMSAFLSVLSHAYGQSQLLGLSRQEKFPDVPIGLWHDGLTAYFGFLRICEPKAGETVVVNTAAGAVGSVVGQIAKIKGCRVIGYAGSDTKCKWIQEDLGFDYAFNYKTTDLNQSLQEAAPNGVDCYFDNVGGTFSVTVINHMNDFGRISICGSTSSYNLDNPEEGPHVFEKMLFKQIKMEGFNVYRWKAEWREAIKQLQEWVKEGKLKYRETIIHGFENLPKAFIRLFSGDSIGKALVKV